MGNNKEIRQRMETYRSILLVLNWIGAVVLIIVGIVLTNSRYTQSIGIGVIIGSFVIGIIGHFLINVALAIPFILLNNGDILESIKNNKDDSSFSSNEFIPTHCVKLLTASIGLGLRKNPYPRVDPFTKIPNGTMVQHINTGDDVMFQGRTRR